MGLLSYPVQKSKWGKLQSIFGKVLHIEDPGAVAAALRDAPGDGEISLHAAGYFIAYHSGITLTEAYRMLGSEARPRLSMAVKMATPEVLATLASFAAADPPSQGKPSQAKASQGKPKASQAKQGKPKA